MPARDDFSALRAPKSHQRQVLCVNSLVSELSKNGKFIFAVILTLAAISLTLGAAKHYLAWDDLSIPVFLIYSKNNDLDNSEKVKIMKSLGLDPKFESLQITEEKDALFFTNTASLLAQLERTAVGNSQTFNLFKLYTPTFFAKKELRYLVEKSFSGKERRIVLRSLIVVLDLSEYPSDSPNSKITSFRNDLIYIKDNFGGVGLLVNEIEDIKNMRFGETLHAVLMDKVFYF